ncbi:MAG: hypothetical protein ABI910_13600, partial [Gemmatimonadota bacterium]
MTTTRLLGTLTLLTGLAACSSDPVASDKLSAAASALINADVATVSAETVGQEVELMRGPGGIYGLGLAAERGRFECTNVSRGGLTATRSCIYKDAAGNTQAAYDAATTASVSVNATIAGTMERGPVSMTVDRTSDFAVSGLAGAETVATWNGGGHGTISRVRTTENGATRQYDMSYTGTRTNVVLPVPRTDTSWPLSGTVTRTFTVTITGGPNDGKTTTREVVITFNGTSTPVATINGEAWELDLTNRGR